MSNDAIIRIVSGKDDGKKGAWWMILLSLSDRISLRMRSAMLYVFPDTTITELGSINYIMEKNYHMYDASLIYGIGNIINCIRQKLSANSHSCNDDWEEEGYLEDDYYEGEYPDDEEILDVDLDKDPSIEDLELGVRSYHCLKKAGITTIKDLKALSDHELMQIHNLGRKCLAEIKDKLVEYDHCKEKDTEESPSRNYMAELNELVGLKDVKDQIRRVQAFAKMNRDMKELGRDSIPIVLNMEFVGNPGTAKTTVARIVAGIFKEIGILSSDKIVEVGRADLIAKYEGQTATKVKDLFKKAEGRLLFIDEAYSLADCWAGDYADEAISTIVQEMENNRENTIVIFAGYPDKMADFISRNPGLRSRVPFRIVFEDYSAEDMVRIAEIEAKKRGFTIDSEAEKKLKNICDSAIENTEVGNGRFCRNMVEAAILHYAERVYGNSDSDLEKNYVLTANDFSIPVSSTNRNKICPIGFRISA